MINVLDLFRLDGQVAVVTGGGGGIGRGIALGLAGAGADVAIAGRRAAPLEETAALIRAKGRGALAIPTDVTRPESVQKLIDATLKEFGKITIWVSNAGGLQEQKLGLLSQTSDESWDATTTLNFKAVWQCAKAAQVVLPDGGCIINVSSIGGLRDGAPHNGVYTASKAAVNHLTKTLAQELAPRRIRVNAIAPGPVATEDYHDASGFTEAQFEKLAAKQPLGRLGKDEDFGAAAVYLASRASEWVTGHILVVSGGV
jgi:7-alpha-hydroxysteroid dehydrogenase